jgi:hypothetical protein
MDKTQEVEQTVQAQEAEEANPLSDHMASEKASDMEEVKEKSLTERLEEVVERL